jgi:hypothetical protein
MSKSTVTGSDESRSPQIINLPSKLPPPTGNLLHDSCQARICYTQSIRNRLIIYELECSKHFRIALRSQFSDCGNWQRCWYRSDTGNNCRCVILDCLVLQLILLLCIAPIIASHWAIATFAIVSSGTWYVPIQVIFRIDD